MLEIKNLTCGYDTKFLLQDVNLRIETGEILGIIGPNGAGKTTLLRAITRLIQPQKGEIFFAGENIWQINLKELARKIAVVSQNPPIEFLTAEEYILLGRIPHYSKFQFFENKRDFEIGDRCLALTNTLHLRDRMLSQISSGERQLVAIARALAQQPQLLLLDEPTAHLDITHQVTILDLVRRLNREFNLTVIMVLHDLNLAGEYCQRLSLLNNGRIHKIGIPEEVLTYQSIEEVYKTVVVVEKNPISKKPFVLLVSEEERQKVEK